MRMTHSFWRCKVIELYSKCHHAGFLLCAWEATNDWTSAVQNCGQVKKKFLQGSRSLWKRKDGLLPDSSLSPRRSRNHQPHAYKPLSPIHNLHYKGTGSNHSRWAKEIRVNVSLWGAKMSCEVQRSFHWGKKSFEPANVLLFSKQRRWLGFLTSPQWELGNRWRR